MCVFWRGEPRLTETKRKIRKTVFGALLAAAIITILLLTFQDSEGTVRLSESIRLWLERFGFQSDFHSFRSNAHLAVYFLFGLILSLFGRECGWCWWMIFAVGAGVGLIDESIKVMLPTREFDVIDLIKDWIGVTMAMSVIRLMGMRKNGRDAAYQRNCTDL